MTAAYRRGEWFRRFHPNPAAPIRIVLFPHAGGSAGFYFKLSELLSSRFEVLVVQYPGRHDRQSEPLIASIEELASRVAEKLSPGVAVFGHSMGATVAFEVARRLPVRALFVSSRESPERIRDQGIHRRSDPELLKELRAMYGTSTDLFDDPDLAELFLPVVRNDYRAAETYRYRAGPPLDSPIVALAATGDPSLTPGEMSHWRPHSRSRFDIHEFEGDHFYIEPRRAAVARVITGHLREAPEYVGVRGGPET